MPGQKRKEGEKAGEDEKRK
jgi:hypothetical protein